MEDWSGWTKDGQSYYAMKTFDLNRKQVLELLEDVEQLANRYPWVSLHVEAWKTKNRDGTLRDMGVDPERR